MFDEWVGKLGWKGILDLPFIALSNGKTMRTRIARTVIKAPEVLSLDEPSSECFCLLFLAFCSLPLLSIFYHLAISFLPSVSSFLLFYFFLACSRLAYLSAYVSSSLRFSLSSRFYSFVHLSSRCVHFPRFLLPISFLKIFIAFPPYCSISIPLPLLFTFFPSPPLPHFRRLQSSY